MAVQFVLQESPPDRAAFADLLVDYYTVIGAKLRGAGGPVFDPREIADGVWSGIGQVMPPRGRLCLVTEDGGRLLGCCSLQEIAPGAGELKRFFLRPEAKGQGLGRRLAETMLTEARAIGWPLLCINSVRGNRESLALFEKMGFAYCDRYEGCVDPMELDPFFVYMTKNLA